MLEAGNFSKDDYSMKNKNKAERFFKRCKETRRLDEDWALVRTSARKDYVLQSSEI